MASCPGKYNNNEDSRRVMQHNPLKSTYDYIQPTKNSFPSINEFSPKLCEAEIDNSAGLNGDISSQHSTDGSHLDINAPFDCYENNYNDNSYNPQGQLSTAVSKVQIKLNNLINNHKASLKLYDDIVNLFNEYITSPNFDAIAKLMSRKSFIKSMESLYCVTHLRPMNTEVRLHDKSRVTVPVFDAKAMILDLLSNKNLMNKSNRAEGYNVFSGDVDPTNQSNKKYSEIHTGDEWIPASDHFCSRPDANH